MRYLKKFESLVFNDIKEFVEEHIAYMMDSEINYYVEVCEDAVREDGKIYKGSRNYGFIDIDIKSDTFIIYNDIKDNIIQLVEVIKDEFILKEVEIYFEEYESLVFNKKLISELEKFNNSDIINVFTIRIKK